MDKLISVIVPVYNAAEFLPRCVDSIIRQSHKNLEIILVNDGSTDNSGAICDQYAVQDSRVKVLHQPNKGVSAARNAGIDAAVGQWLGFVDSDDCIEETMFEELLTAAESSGKQLAVCGFLLHHHSGRIIERACPEIPQNLSWEEALPYLISWRYFEGYLWNKLFARQVFDTGARLDENLHFLEDLVFVLKILPQTNGLVFVPKTLYNYNMHTENASSNFNQKRLDEFAAQRQIIELVKPFSKQLETTAKARYSAAAIGMLYHAARNSKKKICPNLRKKLRKEALRYKFEHFLTTEFNLKQKIRNVLIFLSPRLCYIIWHGLKRRVRFSWWK